MAENGEERGEHGTTCNTGEDALAYENLGKGAAFCDHKGGEEEDKVCGHEGESEVASIEQPTGNEAGDEDERVLEGSDPRSGKMLDTIDVRVVAYIVEGEWSGNLTVS